MASAPMPSPSSHHVSLNLAWSRGGQLATGCAPGAIQLLQLLVPFPPSQTASGPSRVCLPSSLGCHLSAPGKRDANFVPSLKAHSGHWKMNYVSFISKKQSRSPFVIKFAVRETLLYLITSDISWLLVLETIKV